MEGDPPPNEKEETNFGNWWRPSGDFSKPLLANPDFRKQFLKRTREILEEIYVEEVYIPIIEDLVEQLRPEVAFRAKALNLNSEMSLKRFDQNIDSLKLHLVKRSEFLLNEEELKF